MNYDKRMEEAKDQHAAIFGGEECELGDGWNTGGFSHGVNPATGVHGLWHSFTIGPDQSDGEEPDAT